MLDIGWMELAIVGVIALLILGPKDFPAAVRAFTQTVGKARGLANEFRSSIDEIVEQSEVKELKNQIEGEINREISPDDFDDGENQIGTDFDYMPPEWHEDRPTRLSDSDRRPPARKKAARVRLKENRGAPERRSRRKVRG